MLYSIELRVIVIVIVAVAKLSCTGVSLKLFYFILYCVPETHFNLCDIFDNFLSTYVV